jgi:hypothetical protein
VALRVPVAVLRAVESMPRLPEFVIRHDPSRHPSADVVVVAGAAGAAPVGEAPVGVAPVGVVVGVVLDDASALGELEADVSGVLATAVGDDEDEDDDPRDPV